MTNVNYRIVAEDDIGNPIIDKIKQAVIPTQEENAALAKRVKVGDKEAENEIVIRNGKLALYFIKKYKDTIHLGKGSYGNMYDDDLLQTALMAIARAAYKYDEEKGSTFSSYAAIWIQWKLQRMIDNESKLIKIPTNKAMQFRKICHYLTEHNIENIDKSNIHEIASELGLDTETLEDYKNRYSVLSFDKQISDDDDMEIKDVIADDAAGPETLYMQQDLRSALEKTLKDYIKNSSMKDKDRNYEIFVRHLGLFGNPPETMESLAEEYGIAKQRIDQIIKNIIRQLSLPRNSKYTRDLRVFLEQ